MNGLDTRGEHYVVAVRANFSVVLWRKADEPRLRVDEVLSALPRWQWQTIRGL